MEIGDRHSFRKGFYFSFDALLALSLMAATLVVVYQSSMVSSDPFRVDAIDYARASMTGQDSMKVASRQTYSAFNDSFRQELVDETAMEASDLDRTILDGISLLWASRNFTYAEKVTKRYFDKKIPSDYDYKLVVTEEGTTTTIYQTSDMPANPELVSSIGRLVSGHKIDRPSEGFQARARAVEAETNQTKVVNIPMMGSGALNQKLRLSKKFRLNASKIHEAKLYFAAHWGESNFNSNTVEVNGQSVPIGGSQSSDWVYYAEKNSTTLGFDSADVTSEVKEGWNEFFLEFNNQNNHHVHIHPGTRLMIRYESENAFFPDAKRDYFTNIEGTASNKNKKGGAWITKPVHIPDDAILDNASLRLNVKDVTDAAGKSDVKVFVDKQTVYETNLSGSMQTEIDLKNALDAGTNVVSVYVNTIVKDGQVTGFSGYPDNPKIYSDPQNDPDNSSSIYIDYTSEKAGIQYGKIEIIDSQEVGGSADNPKTFQKDLSGGKKIVSAYLNLAQLDSRNVTVEAGGSEYNHIFTSPREYATPSKIGINTSVLDSDSSNQFRVSDECRIKCSILPQSSLETHLMVKSQVGYGGMFSNQTAAVNDAKKRLKDMLGRYADATSIDSDTVSTGNQPYLWGPASVKLVIWRE